jgi:hypothetical protein
MAKATEDGLKFYRLSLENFKNLESKIVDIGGHSFIITGKNGAGKSSVIQALMSPLDAKVIPTKPVKDGEEKAVVEVDIAGVNGGVPVKYTLTLYFTPKNERGRLVVTNDKGETIKSPATFVKSLIGAVSFDVCEWLNEPTAKKLEKIKELTGCKKEIDIINLNIKTKKDEKKAKKSRADDLEAILKNHAFSQDEISLYSEPVDIKPLQERLSKVAENQAVYDNVSRKTKGFEDTIIKCNKNIESSAAEIGRLKALIAAQETIISENESAATQAAIQKEKGEEWLSRITRPDSGDINKLLLDATTHNEKCNQIGILAEQQREMIKVKQEVGAFDLSIEKLEGVRSDIISKSQLPIPGLTFTDTDILIDNIPLESGGVNKAKLIETCVDIAQALKPKLKVIFVHDGSLFDKESLRKLISKVEEKGFQFIGEVVSEETEVDVKFTEKSF